MKYFFIVFLICAGSFAQGQKYVLLDEAIARPAVYTDHLSELEKYKKFFPVEVKEVPRFVNILEQIVDRLHQEKVTGEASNYTLGCLQFTGKVFPLATGERIDYVITSTCDSKKITMHLCDAKLRNATNAFFVTTWIKYIRNNVKATHQQQTDKKRHF